MVLIALGILVHSPLLRAGGRQDAKAKERTPSVLLSSEVKDKRVRRNERSIARIEMFDKNFAGTGFWVSRSNSSGKALFLAAEHVVKDSKHVALQTKSDTVSFSSRKLLSSERLDFSLFEISNVDPDFIRPIRAEKWDKSANDLYTLGFPGLNELNVDFMSDEVKKEQGIQNEKINDYAKIIADPASTPKNLLKRRSQLLVSYPPIYSSGTPLPIPLKTRWKLARMTKFQIDKTMDTNKLATAVSSFAFMASLVPGASGAPVFSSKTHKTLGMVWAGLQLGDGHVLGFYIPIQVITRVLWAKSFTLETSDRKWVQTSLAKIYSDSEN